MEDISRAWTQSPPPTLPSHLSEDEAREYYYGLPSCPILVARTGKTLWRRFTGPGTWPTARELRPVGNHALKEIWEDNLSLKIHGILDSMKVDWTSTDVVRIGEPEARYIPVILWIGVKPGSLSGYEGREVVTKCDDLLLEHDIVDVEVEIRESEVIRCDGFKFLKSARYRWDLTVDIRGPFTTTLGLPICAHSTPLSTGTGGFFISEGGGTKRIFLVTARHVVFSPEKDSNKHFKHDEGQSRQKISLFGSSAFNEYLVSLQDEADKAEYMIKYHERVVEDLEGEGDITETEEERRDAQADLDKAKKAKNEIETFHQEVSTRWDTLESRAIGHVALSPPIRTTSGGKEEGYREDWAIVEMDASSIDAGNFQGNVIDLVTPMKSSDFRRMINPNPLNPTSFKFRTDRLLELRDILPDSEMRHPTDLDQNDVPCLTVMKRGSASGLTVGRANDIFSYARTRGNNGTANISKEWAILPLRIDHRSVPFSEKGDSGAVIVDGRGRMGGLLTSGAGNTEFLDVTYATPITFLLKRIAEEGIQEPNINPILTA